MGIVLVLCAIMVVLLWTNALPFPDRGSFIHTCRTVGDRAILIDLFRQFDHYNKEPSFRADDPSGITRAIYPSGLILNVVPPDILARVGNSGNGIAIPTSYPEEAAAKAVEFLREKGDWGASVIGPFENGKVWLVPTKCLTSGVIVFRKNLIGMGKPPKWTDIPPHENA
jgi:hypothetical protein